MKKKGLIIATIVMVLVLAVSLTTATYAWFSTTATTKVDQITVEVKALSDIDIGVCNSANYGSTSADDYFYETITYTRVPNANGYTADGTATLGSNLSVGTFNLGTAVGSANTTYDALTSYTSAIDSTFDPSHLIFAANTTSTDGSAKGSPDMEHAKVAEANKDFINLSMGAKTNKSDTHGIVCKVKVSTTGTSYSTLLMNAALHFYIGVGASAKGAAPTNHTEFDVFNGSKTTPAGTIGRDTLKSAIGGYTATKSGVTYDYGTTSANQATATFYFLIGGATTVGTAISSETIYPFQIYAYIWGEDADCVTNATGCSCTIDMEFIPVNSTTTASTGELYGVSYIAVND